MSVRRLLRGEVDHDLLESVAHEVATRYGDGPGELSILDADNWLSTPLVVDDRFFVKVISRQHSAVHALLTTGRNLGVYSSGSAGFFKHFGTPLAMAEHEFDATERMRELGLNVPKPLSAFEHEDHGVLVMEYLPEFETLDAVPAGTVAAHAEELFTALTTMHDAGFAHGDLRAENVLRSQGELYFIDATDVDEASIADARGYDVACGLAVLAPIVGTRAAVDAATAVCDQSTLVAARRFLDFVNIRPDHQFDAVGVKGALEQTVDA